MGIVFACIAPHGSEAIPELAGDKSEAFAETRHGLERFAWMLRKQKLETIVVATPHNLRLEGAIGIVTSEFTEGSLHENDKEIKLRCRCDSALAKQIYLDSKKQNLPVVAANYGTSEGESSCMPMDWGTLIPLWFFTRGKKNEFKVVIVTPSREISFSDLIRFGTVVAKTADDSGKRIAFVASADQAHTHRADGPYGFHPSAVEFDTAVKRAVQENELRRLFKLPKKLIEEAKPDSLWQIAMLQGVLQTVPLKAQLLSYQAPTYFGMLCAAYLP